MISQSFEIILFRVVNELQLSSKLILIYNKRVNANPAVQCWHIYQDFYFIYVTFWNIFALMKYKYEIIKLWSTL